MPFTGIFGSPAYACAMNENRKSHVLITGATGLVGQGVLREVLLASDVGHVTLLGRRTAGSTDPRVSEVLVEDFSKLEAIESKLVGIDACFYCAGAPPVTTPEPEYRHVTVVLTTAVAATLTRLQAGTRFLYVSGALANPSSMFMPMRLKGEAEVALRALPLRATFLRPGGIAPVQGERSPHSGLAAFYKVAGPLMGFGASIAPSLMTTTSNLARAMLAIARMPDPPDVVENAEINRLGA